MVILNLIKKLGILLTLTLMASFSFASEEESFKVIAVFKSSAMVDYGGKQKLYRIGQNISPTIKLVSIKNPVTIFEINGKRVEVELNRQVGFSNQNHATNKLSDTSGSVQILRNASGMFFTPGLINGTPVSFLVDTGATQVAMNESTAKRLGLNYKLDGVRTAVSTAAGVVPAWAITLNRVRVGSIELTSVDGMVVKGDGPNEVLLGMSFLSRLKMENSGQVLKLTKQY